MITRVIYPGTFDPLTKGHLDVILRIAGMFDKVLLAVTDNYNKKPLLNLQERTFIIKKVVNNISNIKVSSFKGLITSFANKKKVNIIIRGLRTAQDLEYEIQMSNLNKCLMPSIETIFMISNTKYSYISSSLVRDIIKNKGNIECFIPKIVANFIRLKFNF